MKAKSSAPFEDIAAFILPAINGWHM